MPLGIIMRAFAVYPEAPQNEKPELALTLHASAHTMQLFMQAAEAHLTMPSTIQYNTITEIQDDVNNSDDSDSTGR